MKGMARLTAVLLLLLFACGCSMQNLPLNKPQAGAQAGRQEEIRIDPELARLAKETAGSVKGVKESTAVAIDRDVTVAVKVTGFDRLRLKPIKNEVHNKIKELNKDCNIHVTSDKKHYVQLRQIENQLSGPQEYRMSDLLDRVNKIIKEIES